MAAILYVGFLNAVVANVTRYGKIGDLTAAIGTTAEASTQYTFRVAGVFSNLYVRVTANANTATTTVRTRKNTANGAQSISIGSTTTGEFQDIVNTDTITAGDIFNYQSVTGATGGTVTYSLISIVFAATTNTSKNYISSTVSSPAASTTGWFTISGNNAITPVTTTEADVQYKFKTAGTLKNLFVNVSTNTRTTATVVGTRIGAVNGTLLVSYGSGVTGILEDTTHTDIISSGSLVDMRMTTGTGTGTTSILLVGVELSTTNSLQHIINADTTGQTTNLSVTNYYPVGGNIVNSVTTTEATAQSKALTNLLASFLECRVSANTVTAASTLRLRKNTANANMSISVGSSATGYFEDATNSDGLVPTDLINYQLVTGGTGTSLTMGSVGMLIDGSYSPATAIFTKSLNITQAINRAGTY